MKKLKDKFIYYLAMLIMLILMYKLLPLSIFLYLMVGALVFKAIDKIKKKP